MTKIRRHSSHPEIFVGEKKTGQAFLAVSVILFIGSVGLIFHARYLIQDANDRLYGIHEELNGMNNKAMEAQHICDLAILTCKKD